MGSTAWNADGNVPVNYSIPWGAIRKGALHYMGEILKVAKITLGGIVFDIGKQATEGLVVVGDGYSSVTFFLPDDKAAMTEADGAAMSISDYLEMIGTTDYSVIPAWDYFAVFVGDTVRNMAENSETEIGPMAYSLYKNVSAGGQYIELFGTADFTGVNTAKDFFHVLAVNLDADSQNTGKSSPLSSWMEPDGAVAILFRITLSDGDPAAFPMYIGRK